MLSHDNVVMDVSTKQNSIVGFKFNVTMPPEIKKSNEEGIWIDNLSETLL